MPPTAATPSPALISALEELRARGLNLRRGDQPESLPERRHPAIPSGHPGLDTALGTDGWPRGALALLEGPLGSGTTTLALDTLAAVQAAGGLAAWVDVDGVLDPAIAVGMGVDLDWLLIVRPRDAATAIDQASWLARSGLIDVLVLDLGERGVPERRALDRLAKLLNHSAVTSVLLLAPAGRTAAAGVAGVRVSLHRSGWLAVGRSLVGQRVVANVERQRWALAGGSAELDLWFIRGRRAMALAEPRPLVDRERPALEEVSA